MSMRVEELLTQFDKMTVLVAGDFMLDQYLSGTSTRISPEAPVPVVHIKKNFVRLGGAGNVVRNLVALGARTRLVAEIGDDANGVLLSKCLEELGADLRYSEKNKKIQTIVKTRILAQNQQLLRFDEEIVAPISDGYLEKLQRQTDALFENVKIVILSDYGKGAISPEIAAFLIGEAGKRAIPVAVDPKGADYSKYRGATVCTPNLKELVQASGADSLDTEDEIYQAAETLCQKNDIKYMLTTRSERGMSLQEKGAPQKQDFPVVTKEVIDVTGAGDTVIATFSLCYAAGFPLEMCCKLSNTAASIVVSKAGTATATREEICDVSENVSHGRHKIITRDKLSEIITKLRNKGKKIVFTNGCFDLVHAGHVSSFRQARSFGDILILGVNSDESIRRIKGEQRPIISQDARLKLLEAMDMVDYLILFEEDTPEKIIEQIAPDVLVKGKDWENKTVAGGDFVENHGGCTKFIDLEQGLSTTNIIKKVLTVYGDIT